MDIEFFQRIKEAEERYRADKASLDDRIIENDRYYRACHALHGEKVKEGMITPCTGYLFNALASKHADAMDSYPTANILPREAEDEATAEMLSKIVPAELEICNFKKVYGKAWWNKLKNGAAAYGVFFDPSAEGGKGGIVISGIDLLNISWKSGISDLEESPFLFITKECDREEIACEYGITDLERSVTKGHKTYDGYSEDESMVTVVDCYYKKSGGLHLVKYAGDTILYSSEDEGLSTLYNHGRYPVVIDSMYPIENSPVGFGIIDVIKNPQSYIDRLDEAICRNALISGRVRWVVKDNGGINETELLDMENDIIHVAGSVNEENVRQFQARQLSGFIMDHRNKKISELKEIAGNRDSQAGGTEAGVTAYSAIVALQQAGEKLVRDMIGASYDAYREVINLVLELIRQFYREGRSYRIADGFLTLRPEGLFKNDGYPVTFDVSVVPERNNPYVKATGNQMALSLWQTGMLTEGKEDEAIATLNLMNFDGREGLMTFLQERRSKRAYQGSYQEGGQNTAQPLLPRGEA